jgi:hypothetical protein
VAAVPQLAAAAEISEPAAGMGKGGFDGRAEPAGKACFVTVGIGLGRIVALYYRSSTLYRIH